MNYSKSRFLLSLLLVGHCFAFPQESPPVSAPLSQGKEIDLSSLSPEELAQLKEETLKNMTPEQRKELEEMEKAYMAQITEVYEPLLGRVQDCLGRVYGCMSGISAMVMNNKVPTIVNKKEAHTKIKNMNLMISELSLQKFMIADPRIIVNLILITKAFTKHMIEALDSNLKTIEEFDVRKVLSGKRITEKDIDPKELDRQIKIIEGMIKVLEKKSESVGLFWYNKAYRAVTDSTITRTAYTYGPPLLLAYSALVLSYWILGSNREQNTASIDDNGIKKIVPIPGSYIQGTSSFDKTRLIPQRVKQFLGDLPQRSVNGFYADGTGIGHSLEIGANTLMSNSLPITATILTAFGAGVKHLWSTYYPVARKKLESIHNYLKGGAYLREASKLNGITEEVYFSDLVGLDHVKKSFATIVQYLENPESYARRGLTPEKGVLLIGGTRTGKSYSVKALYNEIVRSQKAKYGSTKFGFYEINAADIQATQGFKNLMEIARHNGPCVLFIDEIDLLHLQRTGRNELLGEFLTSLSGALSTDDPKKQVIIIAATNNPENLDKALRASGRLGAELRYELPSVQDRITFLEKQLEKLSLDLQQFDIATIAHQTEGHSFETLKGLINNATLFAAINGRVVTQQDIMMIIDQDLRKIISIDNKVIADTEKAIIAAHFAGQALYLNLIESRTKLAQVTTRQVMTTIGERWPGTHIWNPNIENEKRFEYGSVFTYKTGDSGQVATYEEKRQECMFNLCGFIAEEVLLGASAYSCNKDAMTYALHVAKTLTFEGIDADRLPDDIRTEYHRKALQFVEACKKELRTLFKEHRDALTLVRNELLKKEVLLENDVKNLMKQSSELVTETK